MTIAEIKEKIKTNTKIPDELKDRIIGKIPYLKMPQLEKLAALLLWQEDQNFITGKIASAFASMNEYAVKKGKKNVYSLRETKQTAQDKQQEDDLLKQLDNL